MRKSILVLNAGSSSVKFSIFDCVAAGGLTMQADGEVDAIGASSRLHIVDGSGNVLYDAAVQAPTHDGAISSIRTWFADHVRNEREFAAVGHRVVHGGSSYVDPVRVDATVIAALEQLVPLAPLHQPHQLAAMAAITQIAPHVPQIACFDTAFHQHQPTIAQRFALPDALTKAGVRRYGFHGLSYEYIVSALPDIAPECVDRRLIVAHLGNGASLCAIERGRSVATTMGLTALDGLPMGTRCGALDPGVVLYLLQHERMDVREIEHVLYERSGLLGVSGISSDMRTLLASDEPSARNAIDLFVYRIGRDLGSLAAALGGIDAIVFTGGIGEHAAQIRARVCQSARWLGVALDEAANTCNGPRISTRNAAVSAWVIPTNENLMVARHVVRVLDS